MGSLESAIRAEGEVLDSVYPLTTRSDERSFNSMLAMPSTYGSATLDTLPRG